MWATFLKPGGRVVIAIENQLGLKYFAGAPEDHLGQAMYGIEGRYRNDQPQTFGRRALERILIRSGFGHSIFMAPFPDYKFPASIVTEAGFSEQDFDASALAWQSARRDPQLPPLLSFSPELAWPGIFDNKIALDLANSFLVVASPSDHQLIDSRVLAYHFSTDRYPQHCKETQFVRNKNESIKVVCRSLSQGREEKSSSSISFHPEPESDYILGTALSRDFVDIVSRDGWRIEEIGEFILRYLNIVAHLSSSKQMSINCCSLEDSISGAVFDVIPQNIIVAEGGEWHLIDREWKLRSDITLGYLVFRALISLINLVSRFGSAEDVILSTPCELIVAAFNSIGFNIGAQELENYMAFDLEIQCQVSGWVINKQDSINWLHTYSLPKLSLSRAVSVANDKIFKLDQMVTERVQQIDTLGQALADRDNQIARLSEALSDRDGQLEQIISSHSWQFTKPARFLGWLARGEFRVVMASLRRYGNTNALRPKIRQARNALGSVASGGFKGLRNRSLASKGDLAVGHAETTMIAPCGKTWVIMTTRYTLFIAHLIEVRLKAHGWDVELVTEAPTSFDRDWYVVLCPQMFKLLPPAEKRIVYQLEQSVSSRWFTAEYINILEDSFAVLDYSLVNIDYLKQRDIIYPHVHYLPIGSSENYGSKTIGREKTFDVLFYGEITAGRQRLLSALQEHFDVCVVTDVFGEKMQELIKSARIVLNLHFYESALLETTRIQECLSLGVPVVSESAQDQDDYPEIAGGVIYFKEGSIEEMLSAVRRALDNPISVESIRSSVNLGASRFALMFDKFLVTTGLLQTSIAQKNDFHNCQ